MQQLLAWGVWKLYCWPVACELKCVSLACDVAKFNIAGERYRFVHLFAAAPPAWCCTIDGDVGACPDHASFDPEGLTSTFTCVVASLIGLHFGHIYKFVSAT